MLVTSILKCISSGGGGNVSMDDVLKEVCGKILDDYPELFD